jgi:hypothetical protein
MFGTIVPSYVKLPTDYISASSRVPTIIAKFRVALTEYHITGKSRWRSILIAPILNHPLRFRPTRDKRPHRPALIDST